jgi:hypothetical protein
MSSFNMMSLCQIWMLNELYDEWEDEETAKKKTHKREWAKEWLLRRDDKARCPLLYIEVEESDESKYRNCFRMSPPLFELLLSKVAAMIEKKDTNMRCAIPAKVRLMVALRYLTSGGNFRVLEDIFRIHHTTIGKIIPEVCGAIWTALSGDYIKCPTTADEWMKVAQRFEDRWQYPRGLGAVDGKHVHVQAFGNSGSTFHNYKHGFSIVLLAVVDADYKVRARKMHSI